MNIVTWRDARLVLVKDSLLSLAARLGYMGTEQLNEVPVGQGTDGWNVRISAVKGIGQRIKHVMDVEIWHEEPGSKRWKFTVDVLGQNQCKNCYFPEVRVNERDVDRIGPDEWADLCFLPEVFGDFVATELLNHYNRG
jgi:hypothetical protein